MVSLTPDPLLFLHHFLGLYLAGGCNPDHQIGSCSLTFMLPAYMSSAIGSAV